jgi:hypothetical protein
MSWYNSTLEALTRMSLRHRRNSFTRQEIITEELHRITHEVNTKGRTPGQTLSRVLQNLRDDGYIEFDGHGGYTLLNSLSLPISSDIPVDYDTPDRAFSTVHRVIRDTGIVSCLKRLYGYRCQFCNTRLELTSGFYCEAHHLKPLGKPHSGPDTKSNIIIVCPNHHVLLDYGAVKVDTVHLIQNEHVIDPIFIAYHNQIIYNKTSNTR